MDSQACKQPGAFMQQDQGGGWGTLPDPGAARRPGESCLRNGRPAISLYGAAQCPGMLLEMQLTAAAVQISL